ncbi:MAG: HAMP domain-containing histidine kinase [Oscillospiraceae bacterium]|nr:HAMP domain-containing histidine kinase [Oscillospiraceae bacterium]
MRSSFTRQLVLVASLILLTIAVLISAVYPTMSGYLAEEKRRTLQSGAEAIADLTRAYVTVGDLQDSWDFRMSMSLASRVSDADTVVCDTDGQVLVCTCSSVSCEEVGKYVPESYLMTFSENAEPFSVGTLSGLYEENRYLQGCRLNAESTDALLGYIIVSAPVSDTTAFLQGLFRIFLYTAGLVLLLALATSFLLSRNSAKPMRQLADTARRFGHGDLDARAEVGNSTIEMQELASAFNAMADDLKTTEQKRQEFIANVSHELKTPITTISGYLDGMLDGTIPSEDHAKYMQIVSVEIKRLSRLVRSMLDLSRVQANGARSEQPVVFDLGEAVSQVLVSFEQKINARGIDVRVELPERPLHTQASRDSITQVIYNLIDNAVKFCDEGGMLTASVAQVGAKAQVTIRNTGAEIPTEELPLIFDRFHKLDKSRSRDRDGVGLGLYIVKTILGAHGEDIWVESHDGVTSFTFTLPAVK